MSNTFEKFRDLIYSYSGQNEYFPEFVCNELLKRRPQVLGKLRQMNPNFKDGIMDLGVLQLIKKEWGTDYIDEPIAKNEVTIKTTTTDNLPYYATTGAAAMDLYSKENWVIEANKTAVILTGLCFEIPENYYVEITGRSGLSSKGILVQKGIIDSDYRGEIGVIIYNSGFFDFEIKAGDRIAQMILHETKRIKFEVVNELTTTERGEAGFGSTGI